MQPSTDQLKEIYQHAGDNGGWALFREAEALLGEFDDAHFAYEDSRGRFEGADGHTLMPYLLVQYSHLLGENNIRADRWKIVGQGAKECVDFEIDKTTPEYQDFENKLYNGALKRLHLTRCQVCGFENPCIVITLRDKQGERHMCPNCIATYARTLNLVNDPQLVDDVTHEHGAVCFDAYQEHYVLDADRMKRLLRYDLRPSEWRALSAKYGKQQFMLHDDFYDDDGCSLQPEE